jgi:hypothetical protein
MILADEQYTHQGQHKKTVASELDKRAEGVAFLVTTLCLGIPGDTSHQDTIKGLDEILASADYREPGEAFTFGDEVAEAVESLARLEWDVFKMSKKKTKRTAA